MVLLDVRHGLQAICDLLSYPTDRQITSHSQVDVYADLCDPNTSCAKINIIYNDVELIPQSTSNSCWEATTALIVGMDEKVYINYRF